MQTQTFVFCLLCTLSTYANGHRRVANFKHTSPSSCPDSTWLKFGDTKCFKVIEKYLTWDEAANACETLGSQNPSRLLTIKTIFEQEFLTDYLFNASSIVHNVWIGASRDEEEDPENFYWIDGKNLATKYTNWAENRPHFEEGRDCVEIQSGWTKADKENSTQDQAGFWKDVNCETGNLVVCESYQIWTEYKTQTAILEMREDPAVPIGFLYTELPGQPSPWDLWPQHTWMDISEEFAGLFFRVVGGDAAAFGLLQEESAPRLDNVDVMKGETCAGAVDVPASGWSNWVSTGEENAFSKCHEMAFHNTGGSVRPRNIATKIWKRTA